MSRSRVRSLGRTLEAIRRHLNPAKALVVVRSVPEGASAAEVDAILDQAQRQALEADPREGAFPLLRIALEGDPTTHVIEPEEPAESETTL